MSRDVVQAASAAQLTPILSIDPRVSAARILIARAGGTPSQMGAEAFARAACPGVLIRDVDDPRIPCAVSFGKVWLIPERGRARDDALLYLTAVSELRGRVGDAKTVYAAATSIVQALHRVDAEESHEITGVRPAGGIVRVPFHGDTIEAIPGGPGEAWVLVRPVCDALGIDADSQRKKLLTKAWACTAMNTVQLSGDIQRREVFCLHLDSLPMWLATIEPSRVAPHVRPKLERYQKECARVLRDHFFGKRAELAKPVPAPAPTPDYATMARLMGEAFSAALAPLVQRIERVEQAAPASPQRSRGTITAEQHTIIRQHVQAISRARVHAGLAPSMNSARAWVYNRLSAAAGWSGTGRAWAILPAARYSDVLAELSLMRRDAERKR